MHDQEGNVALICLHVCFYKGEKVASCLSDWIIRFWSFICKYLWLNNWHLDLSFEPAEFLFLVKGNLYSCGNHGCATGTVDWDGVKIILGLFFSDSIESCVSVCVIRLLQLQWKQDLDMGLDLISKAIEIDNKCDFAYETMGTIEVQRSAFKYLKYCSTFFI